jgi:hypothetical protein
LPRRRYAQALRLTVEGNILLSLVRNLVI